ncbi:hypothetical protein T06_3593 [Trichinella sp. T6]|nr:hypothetical protein T06_3593 [Trichinella sp. T6]
MFSHHHVQLKMDFSNYLASCTQTTFSNATTCHVSQTNECALIDDKRPFMAIVICIAQRWKPVFVQ